MIKFENMIKKGCFHVSIIFFQTILEREWITEPPQAQATSIQRAPGPTLLFEVTIVGNSELS